MQGAVSKNGSIEQFLHYLNKTLCSLVHIKDIKFVVSTWESERVNLSSIYDVYDKVEFVFSKDPGPIEKVVHGTKVSCNLNRMIISTLNGLKNVSDEDVVVKMRTDSYLVGDNWRTLFEKNPKYKREIEFKIFDKPLLCVSTFVRNPDSFLPFLYHPSDIMLVGLCKDLKFLFDAPMAFSDIIKLVQTKKVSTHFKVCPEQYIFLECIKKHNILKGGARPNFECNFDFDKSEKEKSNRYLINNFVFHAAYDLSFKWPKLWSLYLGKGWSTIYDYNDWKRLRNKYENENHSVSNAKIIVKRVMSKIGVIYFLFRTTILRVYIIRRLAYKIFSKR